MKTYIKRIDENKALKLIVYNKLIEKTNLRFCILLVLFSIGLNCFSQSGKSSEKVGTIADNVVKIDADTFYPMYQGAALVKKGNATGLINSKGEFIIPYQTYDFDYFKSENGFFLVKGMGGHQGFVDGKGTFHKFEIKGIPKIIESYLYIKDRSDRSGNTWLVMHRSGKKVIIKDAEIHQNSPTRDDMIPIVKSGLYGFKTMDNKTVVEPQYNDFGSFSDGLAVVGKRDSYGTLKFGYINTAGKVVIPLQFSIKPTSFREGIAIVFHKDRQTYSFINKEGKEVYSNNKVKYGPSYNGYSLSREAMPTLMDIKTQKIISISDFVTSFGVNEDVSRYEVIIPKYSGMYNHSDDSFYVDVDSKIKFSALTKKGLYLNGYLDTETNTAMYGNFNVNTLGRPANKGFDPVSNLALTEYKNSNQYGDITIGYINEKGVFVIIKSKESKW